MLAERFMSHAMIAKVCEVRTAHPIECHLSTTMSELHRQATAHEG